MSCNHKINEVHVISDSGTFDFSCFPLKQENKLCQSPSIFAVLNHSLYNLWIWSQHHDGNLNQSSTTKCW